MTIRQRNAKSLPDKKISKSAPPLVPAPVIINRRQQASVDTVGWAGATQPPSEIPIGYAAIIRDLGITGYTPVYQSALAKTATTRGRREEVDRLGRVRSILPGATAARHGDVVTNLLTALRYDGVDLETLRITFEKIHPPELQIGIRENPASIPSRKCWFLYEWITGKTLDIPYDVRGKYVPLLDPDRYVTCAQGRSARHGIDINMLGTRGLCPTIRRTSAWDFSLATDALGQRDRLAAELDHVAEERINSYLVTRESHSTYAIEGESATPKNEELFYVLLKQLTNADQKPITNETLFTLQRKLLEGSIGKIVGRYRSHQIWVGDRAGTQALPSHIAPKAEDVAGYMDHFCAVTNGITDAAHHLQIHPIAAAVVTSGLLAYIHPFDDGNGRVGRLLLQKPLTSITAGCRLYLPISSAINRRRKAYYESLDAWSKPLLERISYEQHNGGVRVLNDTKNLYRFPDLTKYAEFIAQSCGEAVTKDLTEERKTLAIYQKVQPALTAIGLTQAKADLFFNLALQNGWKLGKKKTRLFPELQEQQIATLEETLRVLGELIRPT